MEEVWPLIDEYDQAPCFILVTSQRLRAKPMTTKIAREQLLADIQRLRQELASAEQALRESDGDRNALPEAQLMLSELPGLVMIFDLGQRKIVYINEAVQRVLYLSPETILSLGDRAIVELVHSDDIPRVDSFLHSFENSPHWQTTEFRMRDQAGKWHWLILRGVVIDRDNGQQASGCSFPHWKLPSQSCRGRAAYERGTSPGACRNHAARSRSPRRQRFHYFDEPGCGTHLRQIARAVSR